MGESEQPSLQFPQAYCEFCHGKMPHMHERLAMNGKQVARSVCPSCKGERPKEKVHF